MKQFEMKRNGDAYELTDGKTVLLTISARADATDTFEIGRAHV